MPDTLTLADVVGLLERRYPPSTAESWDAVGLICGDPAAPVAGGPDYTKEQLEELREKRRAEARAAQERIRREMGLIDDEDDDEPEKPERRSADLLRRDTAAWGGGGATTGLIG